jgi:hypothetical protein
MEQVAPPNFACPECGLHYADEAVAQQCAAWCIAHNSCNLEITALSLERTADTDAK